MSKKSYRNYDDSFKAMVALEAIREEKTIQELAGEYDIHPNQLRTWKRKFIQGASKVFSRDKESQKELRQLKKEKDDLSRLIGEQTIELNWLKKNVKRFNL